MNRLNANKSMSVDCFCWKPKPGESDRASEADEQIEIFQRGVSFSNDKESNEEPLSVTPRTRASLNDVVFSLFIIVRTSCRPDNPTRFC
jgi:hypothetical protein